MRGLGPRIHEFFFPKKAVDTRVSAFGRPEHDDFSCAMGEKDSQALS
jgi:hypothetical protein